MIHVRRILSAMGIALTMASTGCGYRNGDFALDGTLRVELSPPSSPHFYGVLISKHGNGLFVSGAGKRPSPSGHVEISVIGPNSTRIAHVCATMLRPRPVPNRTHNYRFAAVLAVVPPVGSTLRVSYVYGECKAFDGQKQSDGHGS